eukprot:COSAG02_NODE_2287_length_9213_cov_5.663375_1_plen_48_part_10
MPRRLLAGAEAGGRSPCVAPIDPWAQGGAPPVLRWGCVAALLGGLGDG